MMLGLPDNVDGDADADVTVRSKDSDDESQSDGSYWGVIPNTCLPDQIADGLDRAHDDQNRLHRSRIPFWVQLWSDQTRVRCKFGAREEDWMDLPATPEEMGKALAKISPDKVAEALAKLSEHEREIVVARFYRKPPILLSEIARGALNPKSKVSYKEVLNIAYRAVLKIAGQFEVKRPIRRPERLPDPARQLPFRPRQPLTPLRELERWLKWYEIYLGSPPKGEREGSRRDRIRQTVHDSRYYPPWTDAYPDLDTAQWRITPTRLGPLGRYVGGLMEQSRRRIEGRLVIIEPELVIVHRGWWCWNIFDFSTGDDHTIQELFQPGRSAFIADYWRKIFPISSEVISFKKTSMK
jgi:hypothetical protein